MRRFCLVCLIGVQISACAPLSQAPLIYSSSNKIGLGIASGTSSEPGIDLHIGVKNVDLAYVPTVVGRPCYGGVSQITACGESSYPLLQVHGNSSVPVDKSAARNAVTAAKGVLSAASADLTTKKNSLDALIRKNNEFSDASRRISEIEEQISKAKALGNDVAAQFSAELSRLGSVRPAEVVALSNAQTEFTKSAATEAAAELAFTTAQTDLARREAEDRTDALAVYGTFAGNGKGNRDGGGVDMGKVFATGLAAQSMADGGKAAAPMIARAACVKALISTKAYENAKPSEAVEILKAGCSDGIVTAGK